MAVFLELSNQWSKLPGSVEVAREKEPRANMMSLKSVQNGVNAVSKFMTGEDKSQSVTCRVTANNGPVRPKHGWLCTTGGRQKGEAQRTQKDATQDHHDDQDGKKHKDPPLRSGGSLNGWTVREISPSGSGA